MPLNDTKDRLIRLFKDFFDNSKIELSEQTTADEVEGWDSIAHVSLIVAIEREFSIRFTTKEIGSMRHVGDLIELIDRKAAHAV